MNIPTFSHSRINTFDQCQKRYEYNYIGEKPKDRAPGSIESFMGKRVHESLEELYKQAHSGNLLTEQQLLAYFYTLWKQSFTKDIIIMKGDEQEYINAGFGCLLHYYRSYVPFTQNKLVATEKKITINLDSTGKYKMTGIIDRLDEVESNIYEIHDYKTANRLPTQSTIDQDRQLAIYALGIHQLYPKVKKVELVWHYLKFNKELRSSRTIDQLDNLRLLLIAKIDEITAATQRGIFTPSVTRLCDWCEFKNVCIAFK